MNLDPSAEQSAIAAAASDFLAKELPESRRRELAGVENDPAIDDVTWGRCAVMGWLGLGLPEAVGGVGLGVPEEAMLFREFGRHLTPGPFLASVLGAHVAVAASQADLAQQINAGDLRVGLVAGGLGAVGNHSPLIVDGRRGDLALTLTGDGASMAAIETVDSVPGIDPGARLCHGLLGPVIAEAAGGQYLDRARVLLAAQQLGIVEAVRDLSADYARTRTQFGTPIGAFQAVKHRCANMAVAAYSTVGEVFQAALLVEAAAPDAAFHAANAYVLATMAATSSTTDTIQNHGGIGFTWEHQAHLFLKRAFLLERLLGPQRDTYAAILTPHRHEFE
jgi:alkylation response protein AidB-like acyl-CoA dehydrogenase